MLASPEMSYHLSQMGRLVRAAGLNPGSYSHADREFVDQVLCPLLGTNLVLKMHIPDAVTAGVRIEAIEALQNGRDEDLTEDELLLATFVRQVTKLEMTDETWARMEERLGERGTIEYMIFTGLLNMILRMQSALGMPAEDFATDGYVLVDERERGPIDTNAASRGASGELYVERQFEHGLRLSARASHYGESRRNGTPLQFNRTHIRELVAGGEWKPDNARAGLFTIRAYASTQVLDQSFTAISTDRRNETITRLQRVPAQGSGLSLQWSGYVGARHSLVSGFEWSEVRGASDETTTGQWLPATLSVITQLPSGSSVACGRGHSE